MMCWQTLQRECLNMGLQLHDEGYILHTTLLMKKITISPDGMLVAVFSEVIFKELQSCTITSKKGRSIIGKNQSNHRTKTKNAILNPGGVLLPAPACLSMLLFLSLPCLLPPDGGFESLSHTCMFLALVSCYQVCCSSASITLP